MQRRHGSDVSAGRLKRKRIPYLTHGALGIGAASFACERKRDSGSETADDTGTGKRNGNETGKDTAESPTAMPERPKKTNLRPRPFR